MPNLDDPKPGFKWPVAVTQPIAAAAEEVWAAISMPGNLALCHPFCKKNPVETWPGAESRDEIHYLSGWVFERRFSRWIEGVGYDLDVGRSGGASSFVSWRITPVDDQNCALRIAVYPHVLREVPVAFRWLPHILRVRPLLKSYLLSVVRGFEWYVTRGEPVPRNRFGSHPWFSVPAK
ncbi:MAG: SRPBCC family protein [Acidimicrobiia bacterium]